MSHSLRSSEIEPHPAPARNRGSVIVAVLAIILLLSYIILRFMDEAFEDLEYRALFDQPSEVRSFAYSMLEVSLASIQEVALIDEGKLYAPEQGWKNPIEYAGIEVPNGWEVGVTITDEGGKLPINTLSESILNKLLEEQLDLDFGTARELSSTLLDWIDADDSRRLNGAESEEYLNRDPAYKAANGPLQSLDELKYIEYWDEAFFEEDGRPNELFARLSSLVSVFNTGPVNLNAAPQEVLEILALEDGFQDDALFDSLDEPYLKTTPERVNSETGGAEVSLLRVTVSLYRGKTPFTITALVEPNYDEEENSAANANNAPGSSSEDAPKTGALSEQEAINYPFKLLQISEYTKAEASIPAARYSAMDISDLPDSF